MALQSVWYYTDIPKDVVDIIEKDLTEKFDPSMQDSRLHGDALNKDKPDLIISDIKMPGMHGYDLLKHIKNNYEKLPVIIMTAFTDMQAAIDSYGGGAFEYIPKPFDLEEAIITVNKALEEHNQAKPKKIPKSEIIGSAPSMQIVFRSIGKLANTNATVLIQGESGTGKELVSKSLHKNSPRHDMPFIALNMADIPKELIESELFGHEKGAFTGAVEQRIGRFEQANGGTLFLDEIGDMPLETQTRLLRVLSNKEFFRVGGDKPIKVDVRILAATHQSLESLVASGSFREDLYYRLNVIKIDVPPLRQRKEDIGELSSAFLKRHADSLMDDQKLLTPEALLAFKQYDWPGNLNELRNIIDWLLIMAPNNDNGIITSEMLPPEINFIPKEKQLSSINDYLSFNLKEAREKFEKEYLSAQIGRFSGNVSRTSSFIQMERSALHRKLKNLEIYK